MNNSTENLGQAINKSSQACAARVQMAHTLLQIKALAMVAAER